MSLPVPYQGSHGIHSQYGVHSPKPFWNTPFCEPRSHCSPLFIWTTPSPQRGPQVHPVVHPP
jgi:hypothetical protein